jgi:hypothetical protein
MRFACIGLLFLVYSVLSQAAESPPPEEELHRLQDIASGTWGFDIDGVRCNENFHTINFPESGETMILRYAKGVEGQPPTEAVYRLLGEGPGFMRMKIEGEKRTTDTGEPVVWDLMLLSQDSYCWHRTDWQEGGCTQPAYRCPERAK